MNICQLLILYLLLINGMLIKVESVNKKLQKSFVEIFGEGWDEEAMEETGKMTDWQNDDKQIDGNDQRVWVIGDQPQQQQISPAGRKADQNDHKKEMETDQLIEAQKREIVRKWHAIKERIKQRTGKQSRKEWKKMEKSLARKLGSSRTSIYKWSKELGMNQKAIQTNEGRMVLMMKYWEMKRKEPKLSDAKIANALKISRKSISHWKGQFREELGIEMKMKRQLNVFTDEQKRAIVQAFKAIKEKFKQQKCNPFSKKEWNNINALLANKLGTNRTQIYKWIKKFGMGERKMRTDEEKFAIVKQYWKMKRNNPKMSEREIAKRLKIERCYIQRWKEGHC